MPSCTGWAQHLIRVCVVGLLLVGCAGVPSGVDADPSLDATPTQPPGASQTTDRPSPGMEDGMISFRVEGGFTNQMRSLGISPGGKALVEVSGKSASDELDEARVQAIIAELDASGLFDRDHNYPAPRGADLQRFEIAYRGATVVAYDTTVPPELTEAVRLLEEALRAAQR